MLDKEDEKESLELKIIYYLNNDDKKECHLRFVNSKGYITYKELTQNFFNYLKSTYLNPEEDDENLELNKINIKNINNLSFEYIRYLQYELWILLEENSVIELNNNNEINIMIKASIISNNNLIKKEKYDLIQKELKNIPLNINNDIKKITYNNNIFDIIVLISNPLMDNGKELRTMNDFNEIANSIKEIVQQSIKTISIQFLPLTKNNFIETILTKKPIILHLICKSTYIMEEKKEYKNSSECANLIFEKDLNIEFINKEKLDEIFDSKSELELNIKNINLFISTPLSRDIYEIFNSYKFKNILVQHTTLADIDYISEFNYAFYENIIENNNCDIYNAYLNALYQNSFMNNTQFCCCFHHHNINEKCDILNNLKNELYIKNEKNVHFEHLNFKCDCNKIRKNFCYHLENCENLKNYNNENIMINETYKCCFGRKYKHTLEVIFSKSFKRQNDTNKDNNIINLGNNFQIKSINDKYYFPNFEKMKLLVGKNKIIFETMKYLVNSNNKDNNEKLNIFNDEIIKLKILAEIIIEYYKERFDIKYFIQFDIKLIEDLDNLETNYKSHSIHFEKNKFVYFIFVHNENILSNENYDKLVNKKKIIFFSKNSIQISDENIKKLKIENLSETDNYIQYQKEKIKFRSEKSFKDNISLKLKI